jgi:hypothetical protein
MAAPVDDLKSTASKILEAVLEAADPEKAVRRVFSAARDGGEDSRDPEKPAGPPRRADRIVERRGNGRGHA